MIAALYVDPKGCYANLPGVECWGLPERDARLYAGPWPVVAHPPCQRWGRFWFGSTSPNAPQRYARGDDGGCFAAALAAVRRYGGVLEHPAWSAAWSAFGLLAPPDGGGWHPADWLDWGRQGWTCRVDQAQYGHRARKATWLYLYGCTPPSLAWGRVSRPDPEGRTKRGVVALMSRRQRAATPLPFRDLLLDLAAQCQPASSPR